MKNQPEIMWSVGQIAERAGISKQAVSKLLKKLIEDHGIPVKRDGRGRIKLVSLAHWDHHRGLYTNPAKVKQRPAPKPVVDDENSFNEARRQSEWLKVERAKIDHAEAAGKLIRADRLGDALERVGLEIRNQVDRLQNRADDLAEAAMQEGVHGLRVKLREVSFDICSEIANRLDAIIVEADKKDPVPSDDASEKADV